MQMESVSLPSLNQQRRINEILALINETPRTIDELARLLNVNYYTIRLDVHTLLNQQNIVTSGRRGRATLFSGLKGAAPGWPLLAANTTGSEVFTLKELEAAFRAQGYMTKAFENVLRINMQTTNLLMSANLLRHNLPGAPSKGELKETQIILTKMIETLKKTIAMAQSLAINENLWSREGLLTISEIPDFPNNAQVATQMEEAQRVMSLFEDFQRKVRQQPAVPSKTVVTEGGEVASRTDVGVFSEVEEEHDHPSN